MNSKTVTMQSKLLALCIAVMTSLVLCVLALHTSGASAAMAPKDTVIGNQASATYVDSSSTSRTSTSNLVQTTVTQVKSFTLIQTGMKSASSNQQVCYPHSITNTGNGADTYTLNMPTTGGMFAHTGLAYFMDADQNGSPDSGTAVTSSGSIAAGLSFNFVVCGTTPVGATVGQQGTIIVSASDTNTPTPTTQTRTDTTTIAAASISVQKKLSSVAPPGYTPVPAGPSPNPGPLFVILDYTNSGTVQGDNLAITDTLPPGWFYVPGSGRSSVTGAAILTDAAAGDGPSISYSAPTTSTSGTVAATVTVAPPATSGYVYFQITIAPNLAVTTAANQPVTTNTATYSYNYSFFNVMTMMNQTVIVPSASTNSVLYSVLQTPGIVANGSSTTTGLTDSEPVTVANGASGQTITWGDYIWNTGNGPDTFDISVLNTPLNGSACNPANNAALGQCTFPTNTAFRILSSGGSTPLLDSNGNSTPDTGVIPVPTGGVCPTPYIVSTTVPLRCGFPIVISATIPIGATAGTNAGNGFQFLVGATSSFNGALTETVPNRLMAIVPMQPTLTKNYSATSIAAGASTPLNFRLTNATGNPVQTGLAFTDTLPSGLRLTTGATATVAGMGCTATVTLTAPSTISVTAATMSLGTATCDIAVNGITNTAAANADCTMNPAAFTNGQSSISGLVGVSNGVTNQCLLVTPVQPTLTKNYSGTSIAAGTSTPLNFRLTNATGNPAQTGLAFTDTLPSGLRLTTGATATVAGMGCTATVTLTAPSTISVTAATMSLGTATCDIAVNGITNTAAANADCTMNPAAFTNGQSSISGLVGVSNGVTNQCLLVTPLLQVVATPVCVGKVPYVDYTLTQVGAGTPSSLQIEWQKISGQTVSTLNGLPLTGRVLWPGAAVDANGTPTEWPGWMFDGNFYRSVADGLRPDIRMIFTAAGARTVVVSYPTGTGASDCNPPVGPPPKPNLDVSLIKWISQLSGVSPSGKYTVTLRYANTSSSEGTKSGVDVSDALPVGMAFVAGSLRVRPVPGGPIFSLPGVSGTTTLNGAAATYTTSANRVSVVFSPLKPGDEGFIEFDVNIAAGIAVDTILRNTAQVTWLDAGGVTVGPRVSNTVEFLVTGTEGVTLRGMTILSADPGSTVVFENVLTNLSARTDTFDITLSGSNYPAGTILKLYKSDGLTLLADSNGNGIVDTGPVAAGAIYRIIVKAELPIAIVGGPYSVAKNAQSISNLLVRATDNDVVRTIARFCKVILEPDNTGRVKPGGALNYPHVLTNVGNCTETITVPANYLTGAVQGWTAQAFIDSPVAGGQAIPGVLDAADAELKLTTTFTLAPGGRANFFNRVTAPADAANGSRNTTTLRITAGSSGTLSVNDVTTVALGSPDIVIDDIVGYIDPGFLRPTVWGFIGKSLYLRANAPSCNQDPTVIERRTIIITGPNGEREELIAIETGPDTGMFVADALRIRLPPVTASDNILQGNPFDTFQIELVGCGRKISTTVTLIDPNGVVFDSRTNQPIAGATVRIVTASGGVCSSTLATVRELVAGQVAPASNPVVTGANGRFTFELVAPGDYCVLVTPPNGYTWASRVPVSQLPGGRNVLASGPTTGGSYGGAFRVGPETGPVIVDIPVDGGLIGGLVVQKSTSRAVVEIGELLTYSVVVSNRTGYALNQNNVFLTDTLPRGFSYVAGTVRKDGKAIADPQGGFGPSLVFNLGVMNRDQVITVTYRVRVGPGAMQGDGINRVVASYRVSNESALPGAGSTLFSQSNIGTAKVEIVGGVFSDRAYIIGKIFTDCDNDGLQNAQRAEGGMEIGVPGVRVVLEDGTSAISDSEGKYSFYGLLARTHVLKIDRTTLPDGVSANDFALLSSRNLGKGDSRIVDLKNGELHKANFAIKTCSTKVLGDINKRKLAAISLTTEIEGRLQQKLETDPNLRNTSDVKALPASGQVGLVAPVANIAAPAPLGESSNAKRDAPADVSKPPVRFETLATPQSETSPKQRPLPQPARVSEPEVPLETLLPGEDNTIGFIGRNFGDILPYAQTTIRVKGVVGTTFKLKVNDVEIGADRVGKKAILAEKKLQAWEYVGIELRAGENSLSVTQYDEFGNARGEASIKVVAPGKLASVNISFKGGTSDGQIADGKTPAIVVVSLLDRNNVPVTSRVVIDLSSTVGRWNVEDLNPAEPGLQTFIEGGRAEFQLLPPSDPTQAQIRVAVGDIKAEAKLDFLPDLRDLIAVGVIEGVLNLRKLDARGLVPARSQDGFEQEIKHLTRTWGNGERDAGARAAMFLKGKVRGEYLLTMAYDSDKNVRDRLFRDIQPDEFYPIYGDASVRAFDAQSTGRFYVRIDNKKSYLLYGDFNTSQATDARKLSNYSRSLTGVKQHYENSRISANIFASRDSTRQIIDEFPANGTSGPFTLSRTSGLTNSEKIEILTRDRNQPSIIVRAQPLLRFADYELEPLTGRILLKAPVPSLDENLNPISLRITYEIDQGGEQFWVTSADAQIKLTDNVEVGAVIVDDRNPVDKFRMLGINAIAQLATKTFLIAEVARTRRDTLSAALPGANQSTPLSGVAQGERTGDAKRLELRHTSGDLEARLYAARADVNFDNPSASLNRGRQEIGGKLAYRIDEKTRVTGELLRTEDIAVGGKRDGALLTVERTLANGIRIEAGVRHARDSQVAVIPTGNSAPLNGIAVPTAVTSVRGRITGEVPGLKDASAYVEAEVDVNDTAKKMAAVGADYKLGGAGRLYARHEFITSLTGPYGLNSQTRQNSTVVGISTDYMKDGNVFSEYRIRDAISGGDAEAALGLRNLWTLSPGFALTTGFERVQSLAGKADIESTAVTFGLEYTANPLWKGSTRLELRTSNNSDSLLSTVAGAAKLSRDWTFLGRNTYSLIRNKGQATGENEQDRLQLGIAYRDSDNDTWNALGRIEHRSENDTTLANTELKRTVELISIHANWQPRRPFTFSARYAAKWVNDKSNGFASKNNAHLLAGRLLWDIAPRWDVGVNVSTMVGRGMQSKAYGVGVELGFMVMENLWVSAGYNVFGYSDKDLTAGEYTNKGAFVRLRYKFDEDLFAGAKPNKANTDSTGSTVSNQTTAKPVSSGN